MTAIPGTNVAAPIAPFDTQDTYPTHDALYGKGGWRSVATIAERDAIPAPRRTKGMVVRVTDDPTPENNAEWEWDGTAFVVASIQQRVDDLEGRTTVAEGDINALEGRATALEGQATTAAADIDALESRATALEGRTTTAEGDINALEGRATAAEADIAALEGRATTAETDIAALEGRATTAETNITALQNRTTAAEGDIDALEGRATTAEGDIDALQAGLLAEAEARAVADDTVLAEAKGYTDATGVKQVEEIVQESGHSFGIPVLAFLGALGLSPLLVNDLGEVGIPKLLAGELVISTERGPQYNYDIAVADNDGNVLCGLLDGELLWPDAEFLASIRAEFAAADAVVLNTARADMATGDTAVLGEAKARIADLGVARPDVIEQQTGNDYGTPVMAVLDDADQAPLLINDQGEVGVPKLLPGEILASRQRGIQANYDIAFADANDNVKLGFIGDKLLAEVDEFVAQSSSYDYDLAFADDDDNVLFGVKDGKLLLPASDDSVVAELEAYAAAIPVGELSNGNYAPLIWDRSHIIGNGQSLMYGQEAWPALSTSARLGNLMLGNSVRPASMIDTQFTPVGGAAFQPLVSTVRDASNGALLTPAEVAALSPGNAAAGETPLESLANGLKRGFNDRLQVANDARTLVVSNVSVPGRTIEQLSKGASPHLYNRYLSCLSTAKSLADAEGKSYGVAIVALMQGEYNYNPANGGTQDETTYKNLWLQWVDDHAADAMAITGQTREPLVLSYQTTATWTRDENNLGIGMAQWKASKERKNLFLVAPSYPVTDKSGHLDANGSRWLGYQFAKAAIWSSVYRRKWRPLEPVHIRQFGKAIYIAYHVPHPPLRFADIYVANTATLYAAKGFRVQDNTGYLAISNVEIVSPHVVKIALASEPTGTAHVWYADKTVHNGGGNLCDSDPTLADDLYQYLAGSGMYASALIASLVDRPYPLANFSVAFRLPVGYQE